MKHLLLAATCWLLSTALAAQKNQGILGVHLLAEKELDGQVRAGGGFSYEQKFAPKSAVETGLYLRTYVQNIRLVGIGVTGGADVRETHIHLPVLYKFYSKVVNFGLGGTADFFTGWKQIKSTGGAAVTGYVLKHKINLGLALRLSKSIKLTKNWLLEPELRYQGIPSLQRVYIGGGIGLKYMGL